MKRRVVIESLEARRALTAYTFTHELVELPMEGRSGRIMEVIDLNGDSHDDLIVGTGSSTVDILFGEESKSFSFEASLPVRGVVQSLLFADIDGDGRSDLLVRTDRQIAPFVDKGVSDGNWLGFEPQAVIQQLGTWDADTGDFNDDAFADIVYGVGDELKIRTGNGDGTFAAPLSWVLPTGSHQLEVGDFNTDGFADIVATATKTFSVGLGGSESIGPVIVLTNDTDGAFESTELERLAGSSLEVFDYNRDQHFDILLGGFSGDTITANVYQGDGSGAFQVASRVPGEYRQENSGGQRAFTFPRQDGHGAYVPGGLFLSAPNVTAVSRSIDLEPWRSGVVPHFADLDEDGSDEVIGLVGRSLAVYSESQPSLLETDNVRRLVNRRQRGASIEFVEDFDLDGYMDLVWLESFNDFERKISFGIRRGTPFGLAERELFEFDTSSISSSDNVYDVRDVNGDNIPDILIRANQEDESGFKKGAATVFGSIDGEFTFGFTEGFLENQLETITIEGDIDGDGLLDRVTVFESWMDGVIKVEEGAKDGDIGVYYGFDKPWDWFDFQIETMQLGDITGDGTLDMIYQNGDASDLFVLPGISAYLPGDVDRDGEVGLADLELLAPLAIAQADQIEVGLRLDMTGDRKTNEHDLDHWIDVIAETKHGDTNLDQKVDFTDFLALSANFGLEVASWSDGDFNGDGQVNFADFLVLSENFGFGG